MTKFEIILFCFAMFIFVWVIHSRANADTIELPIAVRVVSTDETCQAKPPAPYDYHSWMRSCCRGYYGEYINQYNNPHSYCVEMKDAECITEQKCEDHL